MQSWNNKRYVTNKLIEDNSLELVRAELAELIWGSNSVADRWDYCNANIKGMGPAMMSELLCFAHPDECAIWNRRAHIALNYLSVKDLPQRYKQVTGKKYAEISQLVGKIARALHSSGADGSNLLMADYFIWDELQVEAKPSPMVDKEKTIGVVKEAISKEGGFIHDEIRDKLADIGKWLGFDSRVEVKVADGSKVDTVWELSIGNMGRAIYVFEVQTSGSIDSLSMNLLKSLNNPAVQGVVAVSDLVQIKKIKKHSAGVANLSDKLKCWNYTEVLAIHESLELVHEKLNQLMLVPQGF